MSESLLDRSTDASAKELAVLFTARSAESAGGARYIIDKQINNWYHHRARTGFPDEEGTRPGGRVRQIRVWNVEQAWEWFKDYVPRRGGAPKGNRNAVRHGRCVGLRAEREAARSVRNTP